MPTLRPILVFLFSMAVCSCAFAGDNPGPLHLSDLPIAAQTSISAALGRDGANYHIQNTSHGLAAHNARQNLETSFTIQGVQVQNGDARWQMKLRGYGYGDTISATSSVAPKVTSNRVEYRHGSLTEWYVNGPVGLEQGFTITKRPGRANSQPLTIALDLSGNMCASVDKNGRSLNLTDPEGRTSLHYTGLTASDADGKELRAWLELNNEHLLLRVADAAARYPVVFDPFIQQAELIASPGSPGAAFGASVAIDGSTIVIGADLALGPHGSQGAAYVFVKPAAGWQNMRQTATLRASDGLAEDGFGVSVAISGNSVVVGSPGSGGKGGAYVFVEPSAGWIDSTETAKLTASDGVAQDLFGDSVSINGSTVAVGASIATVNTNQSQGATYVFVQPASGWTSMTQTAKLTSSDGAAGDRFGYSVAMSGNTILVGAIFARAVGVAYIFVKPAHGGWTDTTQTAELSASDGEPGDLFGISVSISGDTAVAGTAPGLNTRDSAYVFVRSATGWIDATETAKLTTHFAARFGNSVAVSGNIIAVGAPLTKLLGRQQGATFVFVRPNTGWKTTSRFNAQLTASDARSQDYFGSAVAVVGTTILVGAIRHPNSGPGAAYVFGP